MADHAILSASGSAKWLVCTPAARLEEQFDNEDSTEASEGTKAHELAAFLGRQHFFGDKIPDFSTKERLEAAGFNAEMLEAAQIFVAECSALVAPLRAAGEPFTVLIEQRLDYSRWAKEGFGTGDFVLLSTRKIWVRDFKYGKGIPVSAENNSQMKIYALGAIADLSFAYDEVETIEVGINQPRIGLGHVSTWEVSMADLLDWADNVVRLQADKAWNGAGEFVPGEHCTDSFCRARFNCRARADLFLGLAKPDKAGHLLSPEEIAELLPHLGQIASWAKAVAEYALKKAVEGVVFPGHKLVEGKSSRFISDPKKAAVRLVANGVSQEALFPEPEPKMIGITALQDLIGKNKFEELLGDLLVKPAGKPTLVPDKDPRPVWQPNSTAEDDFLF